MFYVFCKNAKKEFNFKENLRFSFDLSLFKENPRFSFDLSLFKENPRFSFDLSLLLAKLYQVIYKKKLYTIEEFVNLLNGTF